MNGKVNSRFDLLGNSKENSIKETINEEVEEKKISLWDKVKSALKYAPIIGTTVGIGIATALSMGIVPGIIATSATGLGMLTGVFRRVKVLVLSHLL
ncbi:MAG: hypothetical protein ACFFG0_26325 [Candidatus Thorarchaeota archaeon]